MAEVLQNPPVKPRRHADIRAFREKSLLHAALVTVARFDIEGATVARICAEAGASRGLISHYFDNKEDLLLAALNGLFDEAQQLKSTIAANQTLNLVDRIRRIAQISFKPPIYAWETAAAWQAFTNASRSNPVYRAPIRESTRESVATVQPLFEQLAAQQGLSIDAGQASRGLFILIDGLWNSLATDKDSLLAEQAIAHCDIYIDGCIKTD